MRLRTYRYTLLAVLACIIIYALFNTLPRAFSTYTFNVAGTTTGQGIVISAVTEETGTQLRAGDLLVRIEGRDVADWFALYENNLTEYYLQRQSWIDKHITLELLRDGVAYTARLAVQPLDAQRIALHFGVRLILFALITALILFLLFANRRDHRAQLVTFCFSGVLLWIASDTPMWPAFMAPIIPSASRIHFALNELIFTFALQFTLSSLLHFLLVFPVRKLSAKQLRFLLPVVYVTPSAALAIVLLANGNEDLLSRIGAHYTPRLWIDTTLLVVAAALIVYNYVTQRSPIQRQQNKWAMLALLSVVGVHLLLWNIPSMLSGVPLVRHYEWMYLSVALLPIAITISIANHHTFGIHGLVRGRLRILRMQLAREREMVLRRDDRISRLNREIEELQHELKTFTDLERSTNRPRDTATSRLLQLEREYPAIAEIRRTRLLGRSPLWLEVYRSAVFASKGDSPVMILGESGTGKTEIARLIHELSRRNTKPYRQISCAQFEHADPAFALGRLFGIGANHGLPNLPREGQPGLLQECDGGTLLLDDFDRLPLNAQDLLLYPLEGKPFEPGIGSGPQITTNVKFLLASNRSPEKLIHSSAFHHDVIARMGVTVRLPPLRERVEDVPLLVDHYLQQLAPEFGHSINAVSPRAMSLFENGEYRLGNVRELLTELRHAVGQASLEQDSELRAGYLSQKLSTSFPKAMAAPVRSAQTATEPAQSPSAEIELDTLRRTGFNMKIAEAELGLSHKSRTLSHHLRGICLRALANHDWQIEPAAKSVVGEENPLLIGKIERKMGRYLQTIRQRVKTGDTHGLFSNLPAAYHESLQDAIDRM